MRGICLFILIFVGTLIVTGCSDSDKADTQEKSLLISSLSTAKTVSPTVEDARKFIEKLDAAVEDFSHVVKQRKKSSLAKQSRRMTALMDEGRKFGMTVHDVPFGHCSAAGIHARAWWSELVSIARNGKESTPGAGRDQYFLYQDHYSACLKAIAEQEKITSE